MFELNFTEEKQECDFQVVLLDKRYCPIENRLVPTGKKVSYSSDDGSKIWDFYQKHEDMMRAKAGKRGRKKNKNKKNKNKER